MRSYATRTGEREGDGALPPEVKICGVCRPEDAALVAAAGADYIGVILAPGRGRTRSPEEAEAIFEAAHGSARVGVFVDPPVEVVLDLADRLALDIVQLHGDEPPTTLAEVRRGPWQIWKAIRPRSAEDFLTGVEVYASTCDALLLDGWSADSPGGTGSRFPWAEVSPIRSALPDTTRLAVAGGLSPANLTEVCAWLDPEIVDVSSGVESALGVKDPVLVNSFVAVARRAGGRSPGRSLSRPLDDLRVEG